MNKTVAAFASAAAMALVTIPLVSLAAQVLQPQPIAAAQR